MKTSDFEAQGLIQSEEGGEKRSSFSKEPELANIQHIWKIKNSFL